MSKNFFKDGHWVEKKAAPKVQTCACGMKYIKTRDRQKQCLRCMYETKIAKAK